LFAERFELIHGRRAIDVGRHQEHAAPLLLEQLGELARRRGLARPMEADHQDARRVARGPERGICRAEQFNQFVMDDFDDLFAGFDALDDLQADGLFLHPIDKVAGHLEIDVGIEEGEADLAQRLGNVGFRDPAESAQVAEDLLKFLAEGIEHAEQRRGGSAG
jgi:hypothetical protein